MKDLDLLFANLQKKVCVFSSMKVNFIKYSKHPIPYVNDISKQLSYEQTFIILTFNIKSNVLSIPVKIHVKCTYISHAK